MIDAGILDGDLVAVRPGRDAPNGSIVVAVVPNGQTGEQEATVKRLFRERDAVRLQPENSRFEPLVVRDLKVEGVVVGVLRVAPRGL